MIKTWKERVECLQYSHLSQRAIFEASAMQAEISDLRAAVGSLLTVKDDFGDVINKLRNVIQAACIGGTDLMLVRWIELFPEASIPTVSYKVGMVDDPECDGTDAAHPAWWRGHVQSCAMACAKINEILDGKDDGAGVSNEPCLHRWCLQRTAEMPLAWYQSHRATFFGD